MELEVDELLIGDDKVKIGETIALAALLWSKRKCRPLFGAVSGSSYRKAQVHGPASLVSVR